MLYLEQVILSIRTPYNSTFIIYLRKFKTRRDIEVTNSYQYCHINLQYIDSGRQLYLYNEDDITQNRYTKIYRNKEKLSI